MKFLLNTVHPFPGSAEWRAVGFYLIRTKAHVSIPKTLNYKANFIETF